MLQVLNETWRNFSQWTSIPDFMFSAQAFIPLISRHFAIKQLSIVLTNSLQRLQSAEENRTILDAIQSDLGFIIFSAVKHCPISQLLTLVGAAGLSSLLGPFTQIICPPFSISLCAGFNLAIA